MCVIMVCKPGIIPPYDKFKNAVLNNPHGWGLIMKANGRLEVKRGFDEKGTDPEALYKLMDDNKDIERVLHVRWATEGDKNEENTHPFPVFSSNTRDIFFMHNGTLTSYRPPAGITVNDDLYGASDSRRFAETKLGPLLLHLRGQNGNADYSDPLVREVLAKYWEGVSKGILVANDLENMYFNPTAWTEIKYEEEVEVEGEKINLTKEWKSSNNDYYNTLSRGPVYEEQKKAAEAERARTQVSMSGPANRADRPEVKKLTCESFQSRHLIPTGRLAELVDATDFYSSDNINLLSALSVVEIEALAKEEPKSTGMLLILMSQMIRTYYEDAIDAKDDLNNVQEILIAEKTRAAAAENRYDEVSAAYQSSQAQIKELLSQVEALKQEAKKNGSRSTKAA